MGSRPTTTAVEEFHTAKTTALFITAANIALINFLQVPLRLTYIDLHIRGSLEAIGDSTRPHAPLKGSALKFVRHTRRQQLQANVTRDVSSATSALVYISINHLLTSAPRHLAEVIASDR